MNRKSMSSLEVLIINWDMTNISDTVKYENVQV